MCQVLGSSTSKSCVSITSPSGAVGTLRRGKILQKRNVSGGSLRGEHPTKAVGPNPPGDPGIRGLFPMDSCRDAGAKCSCGEVGSEARHEAFPGWETEARHFLFLLLFLKGQNITARHTRSKEEKKKKKASLFFLNATLMFWPNLFQLLRKFAPRQKPFIFSFSLERIYQWSG